MTATEAEEQFGRYFCRRCAEKDVGESAEERFSWGVYAGMYCDSCWASDGRNRDDEFDPDYAGESMEEPS